VDRGGARRLRRTRGDRRATADAGRSARRAGNTDDHADADPSARVDAGGNGNRQPNQRGGAPDDTRHLGRSSDARCAHPDGRPDRRAADARRDGDRAGDHARPRTRAGAARHYAPFEGVMTTRTFRAMNTEWWIGTADERDLEPLEALVHTAEARYSRFLPDSLLSRLNRDRSARNAELASLVRDALALGAATHGAFDIRIGAAVRAAGYDRSFETITAALRNPALSFGPPVTALTIDVDGDEVRLSGSGSIDLGGIAKGWTVDRVADALEASGCHDYLVDGGGDIRVAGHDSDDAPWTVGVVEGLTVSLPAGAVCTSSARRRRWRTETEDAHHIIDPATAAPARHDVIEVVVIAPLAATADALATTLIAQPERGLAALPAFEAEALLLRNGAWEMTEGMRRWLR